MHKIFVPVAAAALAFSGVALAQSTAPSTPSAQQQPGSAQSKQLATAQTIKQDLEKAGFSDVRIVAESFVVQAKSKDGDPILMTIGPHGFSFLEAAGADKPSSTGSTSGAGGANTSSAPQK